MNEQEFIKKMLQYGAQLQVATSPIEMQYDY